VTKVIDLRFKLLTALTPVLGSYQPPGSTLISACYVVNNIDKDPPRDWKIVGLECLIHRSPKHAPKSLFGGVADLYQWEVELVQHDRSKNLEAAIALMFCNFQRIKVLSQYSQTEEMFEQIKFGLPSQEYFVVMR
jgi:hypothetical protein